MWDKSNGAWFENRAHEAFCIFGDIFKKIGDGRIKVGRFKNTLISALQILDMGSFAHSVFHEDQSSPPQFYQDLLDRISWSIQKTAKLKEELARGRDNSEESKHDADLNEVLLLKFVGQLIEWGSPPAGYGARYKAVVEEIVNVYPSYKADLERLLSQCPESDSYDSTTTPTPLRSSSPTISVGKLQTLVVNGEVSVVPVSTVPKQSIRILLTGHLGAGKSTFVESLSGEPRTLKIASNGLEGCTQGVTAYHVVNVTRYGLPVYLIDTPGFSDTKISEVEIIDMINAWLEDMRLSFLHHILFLTPITDTRVAGSKHATIALLRLFLNPPRGFDCVTFVTTMWDTLRPERIPHHEPHFNQLRDDILKEFTQKGANMAKFKNTQSSALGVLDVTTNSERFFGIAQPFAPPELYYALQKRIEHGLSVRELTTAQLAKCDGHSNLKQILEKEQKDNEATLEKFQRQIANLPTPPEPMQSKLNSADKGQITDQHSTGINLQILGNQQKDNEATLEKFQRQIANLPTPPEPMQSKLNSADKGQITDQHSTGINLQILGNQQKDNEATLERFQRQIANLPTPPAPMQSKLNSADEGQITDQHSEGISVPDSLSDAYSDDKPTLEKTSQEISTPQVEANSAQRQGIWRRVVERFKRWMAGHR